MWSPFATVDAETRLAEQQLVDLGPPLPAMQASLDEHARLVRQYLRAYRLIQRTAPRGSAAASAAANQLAQWSQVNERIKHLRLHLSSGQLITPPCE